MRTESVIEIDEMILNTDGAYAQRRMCVFFPEHRASARRLASPLRQYCLQVLQAAVEAQVWALLQSGDLEVGDLSPAMGPRHRRWVGGVTHPMVPVTLKISCGRRRRVYFNAPGAAGVTCTCLPSVAAGLDGALFPGAELGSRGAPGCVACHLRLGCDLGSMSALVVWSSSTRCCWQYRRYDIGF